MENWKKINKSGKFYVSDLGRIKIIDTDSETITIGIRTDDGYRRIGRLYVHRLVAEHFCEKKDGCTIVNHLNGIKQDNRAVNLEWTTYEGNNRHAFETGLRTSFGANHWKSTDIEFVYKIYELKKQGKKVRDMVSLFPLTRKTIDDIYRGKNWRFEYQKVFGEKYKKEGVASGSRSFNSIPEEKVLEIYRMKKEGKRIFEIANALALKFHTVKEIFHGKNWKYLYQQHFQ